MDFEEWKEARSNRIHRRFMRDLAFDKMVLLCVSTTAVVVLLGLIYVETAFKFWGSGSYKIDTEPVKIESNGGFEIEKRRPRGE